MATAAESENAEIVRLRILPTGSSPARGWMGTGFLARRGGTQGDEVNRYKPICWATISR
jgi:hypothetical protein